MRNGFLNIPKDDELHQNDAELCVQVFFGKMFFIRKNVWQGILCQIETREYKHMEKKLI